VRDTTVRRLLSLLLRLYPRSFRDAVGADLVETACRRWQDSRPAFWTAELPRFVLDGLLERARPRPPRVTEGGVGPSRPPPWAGPRWLAALGIGLKLLRSPREIGPMVMALAIGVGVTVTAFSLIHAVLLAPLPYPDTDALVQVWSSEESGRRYLDFRTQDVLAAHRAPFQGLASYLRQEGSVSSGPETAAVSVTGAVVSTDLFDVLRVRAARGRTFNAADRHAKDTPPVVISERLVRAGVVAGAIGAAIDLDGRRHRVIGVMAETFWFPDRHTDYWVPILTPHDELLGTGRGVTYNFQVIARLVAGVTPAMAADRARALQARPGTSLDRVRVALYRSLLIAPARPALVALQAAAALLLLLVCLNVGWLFVARVRRLRPAFATMGALGASRGLVLGTYGITVAAVAALSAPLAVLLAWTLLPAGLALDGGAFSRIAIPAITWHVVLVAGLVTLGAVTASAVPAAVALLRPDGPLHGTSRGATRGRLFENVAVAAQIGLVFAIGAQALVFADVLRRTSRTNVGFRNPDFVVVSLQRTRSAPPPTAADLVRYQGVLDGLQARGVRAALTNTFPLTGSDFGVVYGRRVSREAERGVTRTRIVTPSYFQVTGLAPTAGRVLVDSDVGLRRAVVTETPAAYAGDTRRIGETVGIDSEWTIVGVVPPIRQRDFYETLQPEVYVLYEDFLAFHPGRNPASSALSRGFIVADTPFGVRNTLDLIRAAIQRDLPDVEIRAASPIGDLIAAGLGPRRLVSAGATTFALVAVLLAAAGLHGMVSHGLIQRARELAVRVALGATPGRIARDVVRPLVRVFAAGGAAGVAGVLAARSAARAVMVPPPGVEHPSVAAAAGLTGIVLLVALAAACYRPIRSAARTDPTTSLRAE
jgi:predicted permease